MLTEEEEKKEKNRGERDAAAVLCWCFAGVEAGAARDQTALASVAEPRPRRREVLDLLLSKHRLAKRRIGRWYC